MKAAGWITLIYALINIAGGVMGYVKAGSTASIIMGSIFGLLLIATAFGMFKRNMASAYLAIFLTLALDAFFTYRWLLSGAFMPAGLMSMISLGVLVAQTYLVKSRQ